MGFLFSLPVASQEGVQWGILYPSNLDCYTLDIIQICILVHKKFRCKEGLLGQKCPLNKFLAIAIVPHSVCNPAQSFKFDTNLYYTFGNDSNVFQKVLKF